MISIHAALETSTDNTCAADVDSLRAVLTTYNNTATYGFTLGVAVVGTSDALSKRGPGTLYKTLLQAHTVCPSIRKLVFCAWNSAPARGALAVGAVLLRQEAPTNSARTPPEVRAEWAGRRVSDTPPFPEVLRAGPERQAPR